MLSGVLKVALAIAMGINLVTGDGHFLLVPGDVDARAVVLFKDIAAHFAFVVGTPGVNLVAVGGSSGRMLGSPLLGNVRTFPGGDAQADTAPGVVSGAGA